MLIHQDKKTTMECIHGKRKSRCVLCGGSEICEHGRYKYTCKDASRTYKINANGMLEFVPPPVRKHPLNPVKVIDAIPETQYEEWLERMN